MVTTERDVTLRPAHADDFPAIASLLRSEKLPLDGIPPLLETFLVAERAGGVVGAIGCEVYGHDALLRSVVVAAAERGSGLGRNLVERLLEDSRARGVERIYLLTTTAEDWFPRFGFVRITRADVPDAVRQSAEFRGACPDTAVVMRRTERAKPTTAKRV